MQKQTEGYPLGLWTAFFFVIGIALVMSADPITGGNFIVAGYVSFAAGVACGIRWAVTTGWFDDDHTDGRTKR